MKFLRERFEFSNGFVILLVLLSAFCASAYQDIDPFGFDDPQSEQTTPDTVTVVDTVHVTGYPIELWNIVAILHNVPIFKQAVYDLVYDSTAFDGDIIKMKIWMADPLPAEDTICQKK